MSGIAKRYDYQNVQEFYRTYHKFRSAYADYKEQVVEWEKAYGTDRQKQNKESVHERLKNPLNCLAKNISYCIGVYAIILKMYKKENLIWQYSKIKYQY